MAGLADLFSAEDFQKTNGKAKKSTKESKKKKQSVVKSGVRYALPVRVCSGHIRCVLKRPEFSGKTVSEDDIKKKIREEFPELAGVDIGLVKFDNEFTRAMEALEQKRFAETAQPEDDGAAVDDAEQNEEQEPLEIASADEDEEDQPDDLQEDEDDMEDDAEEDEEDEGSDDGDGEEEDDGEKPDNGSAESLPGYEKGCWVKLEIHYVEMKQTDKLDFPVTVKVGSAEQVYGEEYGSLDDVRKHWVSLHPEFEGCKFHYDEKQSFLIPFMHGENEIKGKKYKLPIRVGYLGLMEQYEAKDFGNESMDAVSMQQVRKCYAKKYPEFENAIFAYLPEQGIMFPVVNFKKEDNNERYTVPLTVRGGGFNLELEASDFGGKTEVSLEEIREALENVYPEFSKERTEMIYDERGFVIAVLKGSRKGYRITGLAPGRSIDFVKGDDGITRRIEKNAFGCFECCEDGRDVDFTLNAPKIPGILLNEIITLFKADPYIEAAVQIFFDEKKGEYSLYYPAQEAGSGSVVFERNDQLEQEKLLVMDVHSHNRMQAFFSSVDDHDEKGTRLFLVIGKIDTDKPMWRLRAGIAGNYKKLDLWDVFEKEGVGYEL